MPEDQPYRDPRVVRSREAILRAALEELSERGYGAFAIDGVARRCGVARSTIYRQWSNRSTLVAAAMEELNRQPSPAAEEETSPRARVTTLVHHLAGAFRSDTLVARCLPALIDAAERDPELRAIHHGYNDRRRAALVAAIRAAREAGDVGTEVDPELAAVALAGAVIYRRLMTGRALTRAEVDPLVALVLPSRATP